MKHKGVAIRSTLAAIEKRHGASGLEALRRALPPDIAATLGRGILPVAWYPIEVSAAIHYGVRNLFGRGSWEESRKIGREAAKLDFHGPYRALLRAIQYDAVWDRIERAWGHYNSQGSIVFSERKLGTMIATVTGVSGYSPGLWLAVAGRCEALVELAGGRGADATVTEMTSLGARFEVLWLV